MTNEQMTNDQMKGIGRHSPTSDLRLRLRRWGLRLRLAESLAWGPWGAAAGLGVALLSALSARLWPLLTVTWLAGQAVLLVLAGGVVGLAIVWLRPRSPAQLARVFDRRFALAERLTTALEIGTRRLRAEPAMAAAQLADTLEAAGRINPGAALPLHPSRRALVALGALAVALTVTLWLPNPQEAVLIQRAAVRAAVEEQIEQLEAARKQAAEAEGLSEAERDVLVQALDEAIAALHEGRATPEEALAAFAQAEQTLAPLQDPGAAGVQAGLERAAGEMSDSELTHDIAGALASGDYQAAAQALATYAGSEGEMLTREEELELARELAQAAEALGASDPALAEQLTQAAEAIERGDVTQAREAIRQAAQQMGAAGERVERQEAVEGTLAQLQEGREQIAQASGAQPGAGQMPGQGSAGEQAAQSGGQQGSGQPGGQQAGDGRQTQPGHHEDSGSGAPYDEVYVPYRLEQEGVGVEIDRQGSEGMPGGDTPLPAPQGGQAAVPYREVYADYAAQAGAALAGSYIPLGMKQYVRDYFSSLEP
jgi:hypothetical protein